MAKRLNYEVGFTADTSQLTAAFQQASKSLQQLSTDPKFQFTSTLREASAAAAELNTYLQKAYNVDTGKLDLTSLNQSLKASGTSLEDYANKLIAIGPEGEQAFLSVASAITKAELPLKRSSKLLDELWVTMKNTARWQLTSSAMHGFMGAISTAYGYAQDLNESLNNIRIVTDKNIQQMDEFAEKANKAAQALSTTTTRYTDASLIYYQQGLPDEQVEERTNVTIKMANAAGESAERASEQLTAVWNNFYDGSKSLEYYADVMTALGAATASSTEEISTGLQKFSSIAQTVGLSYEYATAALATITATTRESADVVGTALRTLFARIQGLMQDGEADDGTTLNKYSKALKEVGIDIKDTEGQLKGMDQILNEMAARWNTLSDSQKMALAQTVAGVRQYTQLITLMEQWSFFQDNLTTAMTATGSLDKQAKIYSESWEGARDRVRAAAEDIYDSLINDKFYIDLDNAITPFLSGIGDAIDALGGMRGILALVSVAMNRVYGDKIAQSMRDMATNIGIITGLEGQRARELQARTAKLVESVVISSDEYSLEARKTELMGQEVGLQSLINEKDSTLNESQKQYVAEKLKELDVLRQIVFTSAQQRDEALKLMETYDRTVEFTVEPKSGWKEKLAEIFKAAGLEIGDDFSDAVQKGANAIKTLTDRGTRLAGLQTQFEKMSLRADLTTDEVKELITAFGEIPRSEDDINALTEQINELGEEGRDSTTKVRELAKALQTVGVDPKALMGLIGTQKDATQKATEMFLAQKKILDIQNPLTQDLINGTIPSTEDWANKLVRVGQALGEVQMAIQAVQSLGSVFNDSDMSTSEKFITILTSLSMLLPTISRGIQALNGAKLLSVGIDTKANEITGNSITAQLAKYILTKQQTTANAAEAVSAKAVSTEEANIAKTTMLANAVLGAQLIVVGLVIAAVAALAIGIYAAAEAYNADANAAKAAAESAKQLSERFDECKTKAEELNQTISQYEDAKKGLEELEEGTKEFKEALEDANEQARALIEKYKLFENYRIDENGLIQIDEKALNTKIEEARNEVLQADKSRRMAQIVSNDNDVRSQRTNLVRTLASQFQAAGQGTIVLSDETYDKIFTFFEELDPDILADQNRLNSEINKSFEDLKNGVGNLNQVLIRNIGQISSYIDSTKEATEVNAWQAKQIAAIDIAQQAEDLFGKAALTVNDDGEIDEALVTMFSNALAGITTTTTPSVGSYRNIQSKADLDAYLRETGREDQIRSREDYLQMYMDQYHPDAAEESARFGLALGRRHTIAWEKEDGTAGQDIDSRIMFQQLAQFIDTLQTTVAEQDELKSKADALVNLDSIISETFADTGFAEIIRSSIMSAFEQGDISELDFSGPIAGVTEKQLQELKNKIDNLDANDLVDEEILDALGEDFGDDLFGALKEGIEGIDADQLADTLVKNINQATESAADLMSGLQSREITYKNIEANEDYQTLLKYLDQLKEDYPELTGEVAILNKTWEAGTSVYLEALAKVQDQLRKIKLDELKKDAQEAEKTLKATLEGFDIDETTLKVVGDFDQFKKDLNALLDAEYKIDIEIHSQAEQEFNSFMAAIDDIREKTSYIGEDFVVAADKIRELNNTFPGIIAGLENVGDGTVRLNEEIVTSAINGAKAEVAADLNAKIDKLQHAKEELTVRREMNLKMADLYRILADTEADYDEKSNALQQLKDYETEELKAENNRIATDYINENSTDVANKSAEDGKIIATNFDEAYRLATKASAEFAKAAVQNMNYAISKGEQGEISYGDFGFTTAYQGVTTSTKAAGIVEGLTDENVTELSDEDRAALLEAADAREALARSQGEMINDINGALAQMAAMTFKTNAEFGNIAAGYGQSGPKDSSKKSSSKEEEPEELDKKDLEDIEDRYHEITREIERQNDLLDDIDNNLDRTYGADKFKNYSKQLIALQKQVENYQEKLREATEDYLPKDTAKLRELFGDAIQFKDNGEIANYQALLRQTVDDYNAFVETYNALSKAQQEAIKEEKELVDLMYESRLAALKQYEDTLDVIQEMRDNIEETNRQIADNKLSQVEYRLEIVLDVKSMQDALRDFDKEANEIFGDVLTHGLAVNSISADQAQAEANLYPDYLQQYNDLVALYESADDAMDRERIMEDIKDLQGQVLDSASAIIEWANSIEDIIPDAVDAARERYQLFLDQLEHNTTVLDTIKELYTLQGVTYKTLDGYNRLQSVAQERLDSQLAQAELQKAWYDEARQNLQQAQAMLDSLGGDETDIRYDTYKKARDAYLQEFNEAEEAYLSLAKDAMETAQDMYLEQLERAVYEFGRVLSNGVGLDLLQDKYDHYIEASDRYLDKVNEAYEVTSWYNKLQKDIDSTTNSAMRERLKALQDEINMRREGNTLSEYDLDILNAKYEVLQAQMALEDAQNAKNQLQLVRDRQGNWNYQYTSNPEDVLAAEQDLADAQNEWYNIAKQQVTDVTGEIVSTWQECQEKIKDVYSDMTLTDQERADRAQEIYEYYTEKIKYLEEEKQNAIQDMTEAGNQSLLTSALLTGDEIADLTGLTADEIKALVEQSGYDILDLLTKDNQVIKDVVASNTDLVDLFDNVFARDLDNMTTSADNFEDALQNTLDEAQQDFENLQDKIADVADTSGTKLGDLGYKVEELSYSTDVLRESGIDAAQSLWTMVDAAADAAYSYANLANSIMSAVEALRQLAAQQASYVASKAYGSGVSSGDTMMDISDSSNVTNQSSGNGTGIGGGMLSHSDMVDLVYQMGVGNWDVDPNRRRMIESQYPGSYELARQILNAALNQDPDNYRHNGNAWRQTIERLVSQYGYESGGYTGDFAGARLAFLHEKELVLNKGDTDNLLATVQTIRELTPNLLQMIEGILDGNAAAGQTLLGERLNVGPVASSAGQLEQNIHIDTVEFPNVVSADEIQQAFLSIANDAAQWARRRRD